MGYVVECFTSLNAKCSFLDAKKLQQNTANNFNCEMQYFTHEIEGYKRIITKSDNIHVAHFDNMAFKQLLDYIRNIKKNKHYKVDCIYRDDISVGILYASPRYLKGLDNQVAKSIKNSLNINNDEIHSIKNLIKGRPIASADYVAKGASSSVSFFSKNGEKIFSS